MLKGCFICDIFMQGKLFFRDRKPGDKIENKDRNKRGNDMKDIIDERNEKERISKSIIKFWNVNYIPTPYGDADTIEEANVSAKEEREEVSEKPRELEELYNATTGAYSGAYGADEIQDEVTKGQINRILQEKDEALRSLIENTDDYFWEEE